MASRERPARAGTSAGRVIAGTARGARLVGAGEATRPLGDRVKQTLFAILEPAIRDRPFLDLFAGSGAAGIEALSRGARPVVFVESDRAAADAIHRNLASTGLTGPSAVLQRARVDGWLAKASSTFAVIFLDPPYEQLQELDRSLGAIDRAGPGGLLATDGVAVAKHFWKRPPAGTRLLRSVREERFGETMLTFYRWSEGDTG